MHQIKVSPLPEHVGQYQHLNFNLAREDGSVEVNVAGPGSSDLCRGYALRATPSLRSIEEEMCLKVRLKSATSSKLRTLDLLPHRCSTPLSHPNYNGRTTRPSML